VRDGCQAAWHLQNISSDVRAMGACPDHAGELAMFRLAVLFLLLTLVSACFSFGLIDDIHWLPAQIAFGVSLILFVLATLASFKPSQQVLIRKWKR
jgi:uncharacterized membrane protein YtjA (UPF0391 family)